MKCNVCLYDGEFKQINFSSGAYIKFEDKEDFVVEGLQFMACPVCNVIVFQEIEKSIYEDLNDIDEILE